uniref:Ribonuclease H-like domain-containing protein n=1 Tax=Tanacetum cinerariifolium TaxID=118510 RepID=A0A699HAD4_TANCI|nr:ribonuclease H-like domain-containing protein [Tanacetum cinerariifolium]
MVKKYLKPSLLETLIQQYLQNEHYALWEVIKFCDSYKAPPEETRKSPASESSARKKGRTIAITTKDIQKRRNDVKARTTLLLALSNEHQLRFSKYETAKQLREAIPKTFGRNEATKKTKKNQLKLQYGNFKEEGSETLEQTINRLQAIPVAHHQPPHFHLAAEQAQHFVPATQHRQGYHGQSGILGPTPAIYPSQATSLPSAFSTMTFQDPTWNMDTCATSHLISNARNLSTIFNKRLFPSIHVGDVQVISVLLPSRQLPQPLSSQLVHPRGINASVTREMKCYAILSLISLFHVTKKSCHIFVMRASLENISQLRNAMYDEYNALVKMALGYLYQGPQACLVSNDSSQQLGVDFDETFCLVVKPITIRTVLSLAVSRKWPIHQLDVKNSFLNSDISETIYMHQPPGFVDARLHYSYSSPALLHQIIDSLHNEFDMTDLEALNYFLSISADRNSTDFSYVVKQVCLYMHDLREPHFAALNRILRYVRGTVDFGFQLFASATTSLDASIEQLLLIFMSLLNDEFQDVRLNIISALELASAAKIEPPRPSFKPTVTTRAVTAAECDGGMPPDPISCSRSQQCSLYQQIYHMRIDIQIDMDTPADANSNAPSTGTKNTI